MTNIIYYRTVVNDAVAHAWEAMPEVQPPTLAGLITYLEVTCGIAPYPLNVAFTFDNAPMLSYGQHRQFKLPQHITDNELKLLEYFNAPVTGVPCPICKGGLTPSYTITAGMHESNHTMECSTCKISFGVLSGHAWTSKEIADTIKDALTNAKE